MSQDGDGGDGGCLCGRVRYRVEGPPRWVVHCHCTSCRRASGAAMMTWVGIAEDRFAVVRGRPRHYASSPGVRRGYCADCGTGLTYEAERFPGEVHVTAGSFDDAPRLAPKAHVWTSEQLPWCDLADDLPRRPRVGGAPSA
jgi:hypothetical protein